MQYKTSLTGAEVLIVVEYPGLVKQSLIPFAGLPVVGDTARIVHRRAGCDAIPL